MSSSNQFSDASKMCFALETGEAIGIVREQIRQHLDCHVATKTRVARSIDFAHAARSERRDDLEHAEARAGDEAHGVRANSPI